MVSKRSIIAALAGLNLFLLILLFFSSFSLPKAYAQRRGASGDFVAVTSRVDKDYDALYIIDLPERTMHCFIPNRDRSGKITYVGQRDLAADFSR